MDKKDKLSEEDKKVKLFDNVSDNFNKICTKSGIDRLATQEFLENIIQLVPDEDRANFSSDLIFSIINFGSYNGFEAMGILEATKLRYDKVLEEVYRESCDEDDDD